MKKLLRYAILITVCIVLLLGTGSFSLLAYTDTNAPKTIFSYTQTAPGFADVVLFGYHMSWNLSPFLMLRQNLGALVGELPAKCVGAVCSFFEAVIGAFA